MFKESECLFRSKTLLGTNTKKIAKGPKEKFCQTSLWTDVVWSRILIKWSTPQPWMDTVQTLQIQDRKMERKSIQG